MRSASYDSPFMRLTCDLLTKLCIAAQFTMPLQVAKLTMDITKYFSRKRKIDEPAVDLSYSNTTSVSDQETDGANTSSSRQQHRAIKPQRKKQHVGLTVSFRLRMENQFLSFNMQVLQKRLLREDGENVTFCSSCCDQLTSL